MRPEFVEQVMQLRRKVLNKINPKMINKKNLNGEMFWNLAIDYINTINKGMVPNIENTWTYVWKTQWIKALQ